jgi:nitroimidazol reductase NimA-like FMN-containing flavoprotein (pyridoxamine 5'-phosphate oxidase superfamily)
MTDVAAAFAAPLAQDLLRDQPILQLAYTGRDGAPRAIPIGYLWNGERFLMWTIPTSIKVRSLRADSRVALTVDVAGPPPRALLVRGRAELVEIEGVPQQYLEASHRTMPPEAWDGFDEQVRVLYDSMVEIAITPTWAKFLDFETTAPSEVERLAAERLGS